VYSGEDSELNVSFRRLSKKEVITKLKALAELRELLPSRTKEIVQGCLPYWAYIYPKLCIENDSRVREAAHTTFAELVGFAGGGWQCLLGSLITVFWFVWSHGVILPCHG
jgi:hypothetical protein